MVAGPLLVKRSPVRLTADASLTITRLFWPGTDRARNVVERVRALDDEQVRRLLDAMREEFAHLHNGIENIFLAHYEQAAKRVEMPTGAADERKLYIGACFTLEYAFASAAIFNPSMTPAIDQNGLEPGSLRFAMSLRAVGEGHLSSIVFRRGVVKAGGKIVMEPAGPYHEPLRRAEYERFSKAKFRVKLAELGVRDAIMEVVLRRLGERFTAEELREAINGPQAVVEGLLRPDSESAGFEWLAGCDYDIEASPDGQITDAVLFPICEAESQGMEDMRIVRFTDDDGSVRYYGTYTAYNGRNILPQIVEMREPNVARVRTLHGRCARNKGLALFPRKIGGHYMMSGRIDGENLFILRSDSVHVWDEAVKVQEPQFPWEVIQVGNCGSPIETEAGWLLLTHGVGPMRRYCIGATLLDRDDPTRLLGRLAEPLLMPTAEERKGYVPNVVYSCGGLVHNGLLVIPYGISDAATGFATVSLDDLLARLA
ncbi:MAG: glycoside hydrolase family 130 protein [Planctomycetota bacterium]|nr:glycoside hydrolase family 130 protein [Planctomycetota bacterium]